VLRAAIEKDAAAYCAGLEKLHPERGDKGGVLSTVFLCKAAYAITLKHHPDLEGAPDDLRRRVASPHPITLNWGPAFADRFSMEEADLLWQRFKPLDALLQTDGEHFVPGFQSGPMRYFFNEMPANFGLQDFIAGWDG
jgi:hypothetical protein